MPTSTKMVVIATLLLLNGAPGVGKSTIARRLADARPLTLVVEIDDLRTAIGGWAEQRETRLHARALAVAMAGTHLRAGHDVVVPQYLGRSEFRNVLEEAATDAGARFVEVVLTAPADLVGERFRRRRESNRSDGRQHPEADVADGEVQEMIDDALRRLSTRADVDTLPVASDPDRAVRSLLAMLER